MAQKLKFGNGTFATKEGSTLAYNDENNNYKPLPFTTTRDSIATRVNKEGLIEVVGNDIPRIDYKDDSKGALLLEPSRSNNLLQSNQFDTTWLKSSGVTITSEQTISPEGINNGWKFEKTAASYKSIGQNYTSSSETTFSIFAKKGTLSVITLLANINSGTNLYQRFDLENGIVSTGSGMSSSNIEEYGNGWYRCSSTFTNTNVQRLDCYLDFAENEAGFIYIYGAQAEVGSYATSYIPTNGSSMQRAADTASGAGNSEVFSDSQGVLFANIAGLTNDDDVRIISISDGTNDNRIYIGLDDEPNKLYFYMTIGGTFVMGFVDIVLNQTEYNKIALTYKSGQSSIYLNGFLVNLDDTTFSNGNLNRLDFKNRGTGNPFYGKTKELGYYDEILTDLELEYLTSYRSLNELVTELNLNEL